MSSDALPMRERPRHEPSRPGAWPSALIQRSAEQVQLWLTDHAVLADLAVSLAVALAGIASLASQNRLRWHQLLFTAALSLALLARRRQPLAVFIAVSAIGGLQWLLAAPQLADAALLVALYGVALRGNLFEVALASVLMEGGAIAAAARWAPSDPFKIWVGLSGLSLAAGALGVTVRQRRALLESLKERAARLEAERDREGQVAAAAERNRIAREMHDIVAHNLSVMIALADGASFAIETAPASSEQATRQISATGRQALLEMRRLLGVLAEDEPGREPMAPQPGLEQLEELVQPMRSAGVPVELDVCGDTAGLSEGIQLAAFRVAQEALTNVLKHASRPTDVRLELSCEADQLELLVANTGPAVTLTGAGSGRGLGGMRERALAYGGRLEAGPQPGGGWRVRLLLRAGGEPR